MRNTNMGLAHKQRKLHYSRSTPTSVTKTVISMALLLIIIIATGGQALMPHLLPRSPALRSRRTVMRKGDRGTGTDPACRHAKGGDRGTGTTPHLSRGVVGHI